MKTPFLLMCVLLCSTLAQAQSPKLSWFITPEAGGIFHEDHVGWTSGASAGTYLFKNRLKLGIYTYGRSGPINSYTFSVTPVNGQTYKGASTISLRADHVAFGVLIAPTFKVGRWQLDVPFSAGSVGAGFYLNGTDRETPDGSRVSVWEDRLMDGRDAAGGTFLEGGLRAWLPSKNPHVLWGVAVHYTTVQGWSTYVDPTGALYNNRLRFAILTNFGALKPV